MLYTKYNINIGLYTNKKTEREFIRIRVTCKGSRIDLYTGISLTKAQWDNKRHKIRHGVTVGNSPYNILNDTLDTFKSFIQEYFNSCALRDEQPSLSALKERFEKRFKMSDNALSQEFSFAFDQFIKEKSQERSWQTDMKDVYERLKRFILSVKSDVKFGDFSVEFMNKLMLEMSKSMYNDALSKRLSYLKSFLVWANGHKYGVNDEFITFKPKLPKAHKAVRYLTPEELDKIYTMRLTPDTALERVRDMFVFQCYTSLRYSDLRQLKHENLTYNKREGRYYIEVVTEKNDKKITFPLSKRATEIYLKYKEYTYENELVFPIISNQKYNSQLKELGKFAQLEGEWTDTLYRLSNKVTIKIPKEDLTTHTARRTFIVTAFNEGIDLASIALVTSHSDFKSMKPYLTVSTEGADKVINAVDEADRKVSQKSKSK